MLSASELLHSCYRQAESDVRQTAAQIASPRLEQRSQAFGSAVYGRFCAPCQAQAVLMIVSISLRVATQPSCARARVTSLTRTGGSPARFGPTRCGTGLPV